MNRPTSTDPNDYEILIRRRGDTDYASYCTQLAHMIKGQAHEEVEEAMKAYVLAYIASLSQIGTASSQN
ncbi:MAG: hypothetical protein NTX15_03975 [Candidatus Kapabacteria bacterium]|nr:hypothetical protein [Candidatus Kapabacteria bacterium]